jgi:hypothetical protein
LLQALLAKEKEAYNLSNLWLLEKRLNKREWVKSVLIPFLLEFGIKGGRDLDLGVRAKTKYKVLFSFHSLLSFRMILYEFFLSKLFISFITIQRTSVALLLLRFNK